MLLPITSTRNKDKSTTKTKSGIEISKTKRNVNTQQKDASKDAPLEARRVLPPPNASIDLAGTKNANATKDAHISCLRKKNARRMG
jgi:hypothetical protein